MAMATFAMHQERVIVPLGYANAEEVGSTRSGGGPYGPPQRDDGQGLTDDERSIALAYGEYGADIAEKLAA